MSDEKKKLLLLWAVLNVANIVFTKLNHTILMESAQSCHMAAGHFVLE